MSDQEREEEDHICSCCEIEMEWVSDNVVVRKPSIGLQCPKCKGIELPTTDYKRDTWPTLEETMELLHDLESDE